MSIQKELEKELLLLQEKYGCCLTYRVKHNPIVKAIDLPFKQNVEINGEVNKQEQVIYVYNCDLKDALHTLRHEFMEAMLDKIVNPYVILCNNVIRTFESAFMELAYSQKELLIEKLVRADIGGETV